MPFEISGYKIHEILHQGKRFTIYRGIRNSDQKKVILKVCRLDQPLLSELTTLQHEYQILKQLNLPSVIQVYDLIQHHYKLILVLEDVGAQSLKEFLNGRPISLPLFFDIAIQLVDAINSLHLQNIIHRDINPNNILIIPSTLKIKLADFSISTILNRHTEEPVTPQYVSGTISYISPEQTGRMNRVVDYRTDFYSLGMTFYEMLTGTLPFHAKDPLEIIHGHLAKMPLPAHEKNPEIPEMLSAIITKLIAKMAEDRYSSTSGLKADLLECKLQWTTNKRIDIFTLGMHDVFDRLTISQKLYGREKEVNQLLDSFERVSFGSSELLVVSGYSGIGKTSLVREIYKPILYKRGYWISGKYDQLQRAKPYSVFIEAFETLVRRLLMESNQEQLDLKTSILQALGNNAQLIINVIPSIEVIIGEQPPVPELPAVETQNRFLNAFKNFIHALCRPEHPLVVFLDDLQWIDYASLQLLKLLLSDEELKYILIIGAYRNNEISSEHPLMLMLEELKRNGKSYIDLILSPLEKTDVRDLIGDSLSMPLEIVEPLAELLFNKTQGNPFFINEFLKKLYQDELLSFSYAERKWLWDINKITQESITDNVVDLIIQRMKKMPSDSIQILMLASCVGHIFDLMTLSIISEKSMTKVATDILVCLREYFIQPVGESYRLLDGVLTGIVSQIPEKITFKFIHDRVQQAAHQLIPEELKQSLHLQIGRLLLKEHNKNHILEKEDKLLFEILDHFNQSTGLITDNKEKYDLAGLNLLAGKKAKISVAYEAALTYLTAGIELLYNSDWDKSYALLFDLYKETAECLFFLKRIKEAEKYITEILKRVKDNVQKVEIYLIKIRALVYSARHQEAIDLAYEALNLLEFYLPYKIYSFSVLKEIFLVKWKTRHRDNEKTLFECKDVRFITISQVLASIFASAYQINQNLFAYITCKLINYSLKYGYTLDTSFACLAYAIILLSEFNQFDEAFYLVDLSKAMERLLGKRLPVAKNYCVMGDFLIPWKFPYGMALEYLEKAHYASIEEGDLAYGSYSQFKNLILFYSGKPLLEVKGEVEKSLHFLQHTGDHDFFEYFSFLKYMIILLTKKELEPETNLKMIFNKMQNSENKTAFAFICSLYTLLLYIRNEWVAAFEIAKKMRSLKSYTKAGFDMPYEYLMYGLCITAIYDNLEKKLQRYYLQELKAVQKQFMKWSKINPHNFLYGYLLISAEYSQLTSGFTEKTVSLYNQAIEECAKRNFLAFLGIANECMGRFYRKFNNGFIADVYQKNAYYPYLKWGANAKCALLEKEYPELSSVAPAAIKDVSLYTTSGFSTNIDVLSIFKATQAISGEIDLEVLLQKLIRVMLENAGAQRGLLLINEQNEWFVEAEGTAMAQKVTLTRVQPITKRTDLPISFVQYVQKTKEVILIQSHEELSTFGMNDIYLEEVKPQSILILPLFYQGYLRSLLYLENRETKHAFTSLHIQTLSLLASQAIISLENARLYRQATHDPLTGLANRNLLYQVFSRALSRAKREQKMIAIMFIDLDNFKKINDTLGHEIGDKVLVIFSEQIKLCLREEDFPTRLGGDEFVIMLEDINFTEVNVIANRILQRLGTPFMISNHKLYLSASIGISVYPDDGTDIQELIKQADIALYRAKETGKGRYQFYMVELNQKLKDTHAKEIELRTALEENQFCLYYQPVFNVHTHEFVQSEVLVRWQHPQRDLLLPEEFIPLAEKTNLILEIGEWVLRTLCAQIKTWKEMGVKVVPTAVNVSGVQFKRQDLASLIDQLMQEFNIESRLVEIEFTESVFIDDSDRLMTELEDLRKLGIKLAIDDFGTFYSSLSYLSRFSVDKLKIDKSFIRDLERNESGKMLVLAIIAMAHNLKLQVVAEGVETKQQLKFLEENGIDQLQGYYFARPMSVETFTEYLKSITK